MRAHPRVDVANLGVGQSRVRLCERNELAAAPYSKRVVGVERRPPPVSRLRVDHHSIDGVGVDLPFPPWPANAPDTVGRIESFQHHAFGMMLARMRSKLRQRGPVARLKERRKADGRWGRDDRSESGATLA